MTEGSELIQELEQIKTSALDALQSVMEEEALKTWQTVNLGRSSALMNSFKRLGSVEKEMRPQVGQHANEVRTALEAAFEEQRERLKEASLARSLHNERLDVTLPGHRPAFGRLHPITQTLRQVCQIFAEMGFLTYLSPEVESDDFNFGFLNMPPHHPAREMWDTFHTVKPGVVLRTHTSPGQIHAMREYAPEPVRVALPGAVYRYEQISARSGIQFYQLELLAVGSDITFADLKGTLLEFVYRLFNRDVRTRLRPNYFPFTEPSAEMDMECFICGGDGCQVCKGTGWLEILGCGMVHPVVLKNGGYDPEKHTGFAAGLGVDRLCMLQHGIQDIRYFWRNDIRFLEHF